MLGKLLSFFKTSSSSVIKETKKPPTQRNKVEPARIGELGEHKINLQLDQLPKEWKYLSDLLIANPQSRSGYSQIDHVVISPYGLFVIETKNYSGEIKGKRSDKYWTAGSRFQLYNPFRQNYGHRKAIEAHLPNFKNLKYVSMVSFTRRCRFGVDPELRKINSDELIVYDVELSEFILRKINWTKAAQPSLPFLTNLEMNEIYDQLASANITDPTFRAEHIAKAKK